MNYTPLTNYRTVSMTRGFTSAYYVFYTASKDCMIAMVGTFTSAGGSGSYGGYISIAGDTQRNLYEQRVFYVSPNTQTNFGFMMVRAGETITYRPEVGTVALASISGTLYILDIN
jgi:hypothetical protein